jgi:3-hydroxyacyl-CoA dehydrogenase
VLAALIEKGNLGQKTGAGFYKKVGRDILRFDLASKGDYVPGGQKADEVYARMLKKPAAERLKLLRNAEGRRPVPVGHPAQQLPLRCRAPGRSPTTRATSTSAMRWGFGMKQGPFELWQEAGWLQVAKMGPGRHRRRQGAVQGAAAEWVFEGPWPSAGGVHTRGLVERPAGQFVPRAACRCTAPALPRERAGRQRTQRARRPAPRCSNDEIRLWTLDGEVLIASIKTKMHAISPAA